MWSKVLILGDSLTQYAFSPDGCWGSLLANRLQRVTDIVTRGFAGYTTRWIRSILPDVLTGIDPATVSCAIVFLDANDPAHENCPSGQHVPLPEYQENLKFIVNYLQEFGINKERIVMLNPPVYYHEDFSPTKEETPCRSAESAALYAAACLMVAKELGVTCVDIHSAFEKDERGKALFKDGLHFSAAGSQLLFDEIWPWIEQKILMYQGAKSLAQNFPYWMEFRDEFNRKAAKQIDQNIP